MYLLSTSARAGRLVQTSNTLAAVDAVDAADALLCCRSGRCVADAAEHSGRHGGGAAQADQFTVSSLLRTVPAWVSSRKWQGPPFRGSFTRACAVCLHVCMQSQTKHRQAHPAAQVSNSACAADPAAATAPDSLCVMAVGGVTCGVTASAA